MGLYSSCGKFLTNFMYMYVGVVYYMYMYMCSDGFRGSALVAEALALVIVNYMQSICKLISIIHSEEF